MNEMSYKIKLTSKKGFKKVNTLFKFNNILNLLLSESDFLPMFLNSLLLIHILFIKMFVKYIY